MILPTEVTLDRPVGETGGAVAPDTTNHGGLGQSQNKAGLRC